MSDAQRQEDPSGQPLGKYRLLRQLGRGGAGVVYEAWDSILKRRLAIKMLAPDLTADAKNLRRLLREAWAAAQLSHPNTITIYEVDQVGQEWYIAMELLTRGSVDDFLRTNGPLPWPDATRIVLQTCFGLNAAHKAKLLHRDIKPANLLLAVDGTVKLADFGLVKPVSGHPSATPQGIILGSPHFMSPEQCEGGIIEERSDLYSLGATYYTLLTGKVPYEIEGEGIYPILFAHCSAPIPDPRSYCEDIPPACTSVIHRAMAKRPADRFKNTEEMIQALQAILNETPTFPVSRNPSSAPADIGDLPTQTNLLLLNRSIRFWGSATLFIFVLACVITWCIWFFGGTTTSPSLEEDLSTFRTQLLSEGVDLPARKVALALTFSPDNQTLVTENLESEKGISGWNLQTGKRLFSLWHNKTIQSIAISSDGTYLAGGDNSGYGTLLYNLRSGKEVPLQGTLPRRTTPFIALRRRLLVVGTGHSPTPQPSVWFHDIPTNRSWPEVEVSTYGTRYFAVSPDEKWLVYVGENNGVRLIETTSGKTIRRLEIKKPVHGPCTYSPDGLKLAIPAGSSVFVYDTRDWAKAPGEWKQDGEVHSVQFTSDGKKLIAAGGSISLILLEGQSSPQRLTSVDYDCVRLALSADGLLATTSFSKPRVRIKDIRAILNSQE